MVCSISRSWFGSCMWWTTTSGLPAISASPAGRPAASARPGSSGSTPTWRTGARKVCGSQGTPSAAARWTTPPFEEPTKAAG